METDKQGSAGGTGLGGTEDAGGGEVDYKSLYEASKTTIANFEETTENQRIQVATFKNQAAENRVKRQELEQKLQGNNKTPVNKSTKAPEDLNVLREEIRSSIYNDEVNPKIEALNAQNESLKSITKQRVVNDAILNEAAKQKAINPQDVVNLILANHKFDIGVDIDGNNVTSYIRKAGNGTDEIRDGRAMNFVDLVKEYSTDNPYLFQATGQPGSGSRPGVGAGLQTGKYTPEQVGKMSIEQYRKAEAEGRIPGVSHKT